ncbi:MAG: ATP-binding cassette domain-containing protein, partial [Cyanobium sp.]
MGWGERLILDQLSLQVQPGERLMVVGPSGSGKSTILRLMAGLLLPTSGVVKL